MNEVTERFEAVEANRREPVALNFVAPQPTVVPLRPAAAPRP